MLAGLQTLDFFYSLLFHSETFFFLDSARAALHDTQFIIIIPYVILGLGAGPQFILCVKQVILAPPIVNKTLMGGSWDISHL